MSYTANPEIEELDTDYDKTSGPRDHIGVRAEKHIVVNKSPEDVYNFWHNFENLPQFMKHLDSVTITGPDTSHWIAKGPLGSKVEWDAEIISDIPNEIIAWKSKEPADIHNAGTVRFSPATDGMGTDIDVELEYAPPGGAIGAAVAKLFGEEPNQQIDEDLERFKEYMESGYIGSQN